MPWRDDDLDDEAWRGEPGADDVSYGDPHPSSIFCPHCQTEIYADSEQCPQCGTYLSEEDQDLPYRRKPWWIIVGSLAVLGIVYTWIRSNP